ncbi:hypothetical protein SAMN05428978_100354 [Nitrosomonas sp. Nm34]|nr:hypothetical protein SAMN05428978_100354 [Nitrosomonas sp. Nm34]
MHAKLYGMVIILAFPLTVVAHPGEEIMNNIALKK